MITTMPYLSATHPNLIIDNQHDKPTLKNVYTAKPECIVKKSKRYIDGTYNQ